MKKIVLTGGPGSGKTVVAGRVVAMHPDKLALVPEAATQVYDLLKTRWDRLDLEGRRDVQRRIYRLQVEQEERVAREHPGKLLLLDRATIDGSAYWPDGSDAYWQDLQTTHARELSRYDLVIWLETAAALGLYDGDQSNVCRFEDAPGAIASGKLLLGLWGNHPHLRHVGAFTNIDDKVAAVDEIVAGLIERAESEGTTDEHS
jgi:predicted ATPase